jgi:hypothetical protein
LKCKRSGAKKSNCKEESAHGVYLISVAELFELVVLAESLKLALDTAITGVCVWTGVKEGKEELTRLRVTDPICRNCGDCPFSEREQKGMDDGIKNYPHATQKMPQGVVRNQRPLRKSL